jgi:hypothetical protein
MEQSLSEQKRHDFCKQTIELKKEIESNFVELGRMLHEIKDNRYYEAGWTSWEEYCMELKISQSTISRLIRIYEIFVLRYDFAPRQIAEAGGWTVVAQLLPEINEKTAKDDVKVWLGEMADLTRSDAQKAINERKIGVPVDDCLHDDTYTIKICRVCGERWKLNEV